MADRLLRVASRHLATDCSRRRIQPVDATH
jgi:hypothetical protein